MTRQQNPPKSTAPTPSPGARSYTLAGCCVDLSRLWRCNRCEHECAGRKETDALTHLKVVGSNLPPQPQNIPQDQPAGGALLYGPPHRLKLHVRRVSEKPPICEMGFGQNTLPQAATRTAPSHGGNAVIGVRMARCAQSIGPLSPATSRAATPLRPQDGRNEMFPSVGPRPIGNRRDSQ